MAKISTMNKPYDQTRSKIRVLWETALQLIGQYEDFDRNLTDLENKVQTSSDTLTSTINGV